MTRTTSIYLTLITAISFGSAALAEQGSVRTGHEAHIDGSSMHLEGAMLGHFQHLDTNGDGMVSQEEMAANRDTVNKFNKMVENHSTNTRR